MGRAYLAIVDRHGLRALLPEDDDGVRFARLLSNQLPNAACYWATLSSSDAIDVCRQLDQDKAMPACRTVSDHAEFLGVVPRLSDLSHVDWLANSENHHFIHPRA